jgi:hypothetical protein
MATSRRELMLSSSSALLMFAMSKSIHGAYAQADPCDSVFTRCIQVGAGFTDAGSDDAGTIDESDTTSVDLGTGGDADTTIVFTNPQVI